MASNPPEINENQWKSMKAASLDTPGPQWQWAQSNRRCVASFLSQIGSPQQIYTKFHHHIGCHIALRVFLAALKHGSKLRLVSKCNTNESETINKIAKTLKSQNPANRLLRYAIRSQIAPRIQCHKPNQPKTNIRYKRICKKKRSAAEAEPIN